MTDYELVELDNARVLIQATTTTGDTITLEFLNLRFRTPDHEIAMNVEQPYDDDWVLSVYSGVPHLPPQELTLSIRATLEQDPDLGYAYTLSTKGPAGKAAKKAVKAKEGS